MVALIYFLRTEREKRLVINFVVSKNSSKFDSVEAMLKFSGSLINFCAAEKVEKLGQWVMFSDFGVSYRIYQACELVWSLFISKLILGLTVSGNLAGWIKMS